MQSLHDVPAPAKLNLFLHVTGRRADGYHLLQSAFMLIDWCDTLHFERRVGAALSREDLGATLPPDDLVLRAARALQAATGCTQGAHIAIDKRIPAEAGLGGGSSDAATTLMALDRLWRLDLGRAALARIGITLGADVPFFLFGRNAWAQGVGERLHAIDLPPARFVVVKPREGLSTAAIFAAPNLVRDSPTAILAGFAAAPYHFGRNDLQAVSEAMCPQVREALDWLAAQGLEGRMTGSGSAVFAPLPPGRWADESPPAVPAGWQVRICSNLARHPLAEWPASEG